MRVAGFTKQERSLLVLTRILMVAFFLATILFATAPDFTLSYLTNIGIGLFGFKERAASLGAERFWLVLGVAFVATLTYICFIIQHDFLRNIRYFRLIIFSKFISATGFIFCLIRFELHFFYLAGAIIDGLIFFVSWYCYHAAKKSRAE